VNKTSWIILNNLVKGVKKLDALYSVNCKPICVTALSQNYLLYGHL